MAKTSTVPSWQRALITVAATVIGVVVVGGLYWAQVVFIPLALAVFLTFLLNPLVRALERQGLGRIVSVVIVVISAGALLGGFVWLIADQVTSLVAELPTYTENIKGKVKYLREMSGGALSEALDRMMQEISGEWNALPGKASPALESEATQVVLQPESAGWLARLTAIFSPVLGPLGAVALAIVLAIFMLVKREDLRNRFIKLVGLGHLTGTTKAVDDAGERISRFLLMQLFVNGSYGLTWGLGLFLIGVDYALLWGFLAAVLRYVPYVGAPVASLLPFALSLIQFPGWWQPLAVLALLLVLELVSNNLIEPWLYGQSIGVSEVASIIAAAFWTFLWGPIGLVLSSPLTVCLVVLGKHVPQLGFFHVILGDEPALDPDVSYYQRLLARDQDEATQLVLDQVKASPPEQVYDGLLVPALNYVKRDRERNELTEADEEFVHRTTREVLEDLSERRAATALADAGSPSEEGTEAPAYAKVHLLACPAQDEADRLALEMLQQLLDAAKWEFEVSAVATLTAELVARVAKEGQTLICIGSLPPGGLAHTRYLCKRLRGQFPKAKILVGRWGLKGNVEANREELQEAGADLMATTLLETRNQLNGLLPVLVHERVEDQSRLKTAVGRTNGRRGLTDTRLTSAFLRRTDMADTSEKFQDATSRARVATQAAGVKVKECTSGVVAAVQEKVNDVAAGASQLAGKVMDTAHEWASSVGSTGVQAKDKAVEVASAAAEKAGDLGQDVTALIRRYPLPALLVGLGMGFLLGQLLSRRSSSGV